MRTRQQDQITPGAAIDDDDQVEVRRLRSGALVMVPRALRNLNGAALEQAARLQDGAGAVQEASDRLTGRVRSARARGLSWESIGWCTGLTGDGARRRWQEACADA